MDTWLSNIFYTNFNMGIQQVILITNHDTPDYYILHSAENFQRNVKFWYRYHKKCIILRYCWIFYLLLKDVVGWFNKKLSYKRRICIKRKSVRDEKKKVNSWDLWDSNVVEYKTSNTLIIKINSHSLYVRGCILIIWLIEWLMLFTNIYTYILENAYCIYNTNIERISK